VQFEQFSGKRVDEKVGMGETSVTDAETGVDNFGRCVAAERMPTKKVNF